MIRPMNLLKLFLFLLAFVIVSGNAQQRAADFVEPFIGTEGEGKVVPGAALPFGMVKLGSDCKGHGNSEYFSGGIIEGFSQYHIFSIECS